MQSQTTLRPIDIRLIDDLFEMGGGYVLDFTNQSFAQFFSNEVGSDIYSSAFAADGDSKAKRLRCYLRNSDVRVILKALLALWEYREGTRRRAGADDPIPGGAVEFVSLIERLGGTPPDIGADTTAQTQPRELEATIAKTLLGSLMQVSTLAPQPRGYAFERFLKELFDANGLAGRASFGLRGEQIDGSFLLEGETYLLEAKWASKQVDASVLRAFNAKVEAKAAWSRGLLVSDSGFSEDGLHAFGPGKRVICMDGFDLSEMLEKRYAFSDVMARKVRRAAETGNPLVHVRDLY